MSPQRPLRIVTSAQVCQLEVTLVGAKPPIWRRLRVLDDASLHALHMILQHAFGWNNSHLYELKAADRRYSEPNPVGDDFGKPAEDSRRTLLRDVAPKQGTVLTYVYDFGDWWEHRVLVEAVYPPTDGESSPCCVDGARAGPPDDAGGVHGYAEMLTALRNPRHRDHKMWAGWVPKGFDPEAFDAGKTTKRLQRLGRKKPGGAQRSTS